MGAYQCVLLQVYLTLSPLPQPPACVVTIPKYLAVCLNSLCLQKRGRYRIEGINWIEVGKINSSILCLLLNWGNEMLCVIIQSWHFMCFVYSSAKDLIPQLLQ